MSVKRQRITYTKDELFDLWRRFRKDPAVIKLLQDFAITTKETAQKLNNEFEIRYAAEFINKTNGGKNND